VGRHQGLLPTCRDIPDAGRYAPRQGAATLALVLCLVLLITGCGPKAGGGGMPTATVVGVATGDMVEVIGSWDAEVGWSSFDEQYRRDGHSAEHLVGEGRQWSLLRIGQPDLQVRTGSLEVIPVDGNLLLFAPMVGRVPAAKENEFWLAVSRARTRAQVKTVILNPDTAARKWVEDSLRQQRLVPKVIRCSRTLRPTSIQTGFPIGSLRRRWSLHRHT